MAAAGGTTLWVEDVGMKKAVKIGLLDSGISAARRAALGDVHDAWKGDFSSYEDLTGHGTACALLIRKMAPTAKLYNLKIFDGHAATSPGLVLDGIEWCIENGMDVVNVSVAVADTGYYHDFAEVCARAAERNIIIVAAADNLGRPSLPAYIKTVFGVGAADVEEGRYYHREGERIQFYAGPDAETPPTRSSFPSQGRGCSFAAARLSGIVAEVIAEMDEPFAIPVVEQRLARSAVQFDSGRVLSTNQDFDFEASASPAVFRSTLAEQVNEFGPTVLFGSPLDCQLFADYRRLLQFPLVKLLGARPRAPMMPDQNFEGVTEDEILDALAGANTLLLGHVDPRHLDLASLLTRVRKAGKNIFSLRPLGDALSNAFHDAEPSFGPGWTRRPGLDEASLATRLASIPESHIPKSQIPVLVVVHLGQQRLSRLKIELAIGEALKLAGNKIAQIGSVPYSELFGCEYSHWSGAFSPTFPAHLRVAFSKLLVETLNYSTPKPSLLLAGCDQSPSPTSFLARDFFTLYTVPTLSYLFGLHPDGVVAVVDDLTELEFLDRSLQALRGLLGCETLFVVHDSQATFYATAMGLAAPVGGEDSCRRCRRLRDGCPAPVICASSRGFLDEAVGLVVGHFGLDRDKPTATAAQPQVERARAAVPMSGLADPGGDPLQAAKALAERLRLAGVPVEDQIRAAKQIAESLRQGDAVQLQAARRTAENLKQADAGRLRAETPVTGGLKERGGADVDPLQAARQIAQLLRGGGEKESFSIRRLKFLVPFLKRQSRLIGASVLLTLVASGITLPAPIVQMRIIDRYVPAGQVIPILGLAGLLVGLYLSGFVAKLLLNYTTSRVNSALMLDLKRAIFERVLTFPISFFSENQSSYLAARLNEIDRAGTMFSLTSISLVVALFTLAFSATLLAVLDWRVFLIAAAFTPIQYLIVKRFTGGMRGISNAVLEKSANLSKNMQEVFAGMSTVKTFAAEQRETSRMDAPLASLFKSSFLQSFALRSSGDVIGFVNQLIFVAVLVASMVFIIGGDMTIGAYVAVVALVERMFSPIQALAATGLVMQPVIVAVNRVADYFEAIGEDAVPGRVHSPSRLDGKVEFREVAFSYPGKDRLVSDVSFTIHPGERVAIVGPNGSGKTTLMKLLLQLHLPDRGSILVDDRDAGTFKLEGLRRRIGFVSQDVFLFNDTILANLTYGTTSADLAALHPLIERCCPFLKDLPNGIHTKVGEGGTSLSGGQRQAVSIVRALLKDPDILIVDEGSAHLDAIARENLKSVIQDQCAGKTCILISHDADVVSTADRVLAIDGGRVVERAGRSGR